MRRPNSSPPGFARWTFPFRRPVLASVATGAAIAWGAEILRLLRDRGALIV